MDIISILLLINILIIAVIYLLIKVWCLLDDLESKNANITLLENRLKHDDDHISSLENETLRYKALYNSVIKNLEKARNDNQILKQILYKNISSYYKRGNKDE